MTFNTVSSPLAPVKNSPQKGAFSSFFFKNFAKAEVASQHFQRSCKHSQLQQPSHSRQNSSKFFTQRLFASTNTAQCSYEELAKFQGKTRRAVIEHIKKDIANGYIYKELTSYKCPKYQPLLHGKNIYRLTNKGRLLLGRAPLDGTLSEREEKQILKDKALSKAVFIFFRTKDKSSFERLTKLCPAWWLKDLFLFKSTLQLLQDKIDAGYRVRSIPHWISHTLKEDGVGFRKRCARRWQKALLGEEEIFQCSSPYIQEIFAQLKALIAKGLDISEKGLIKLFRKGTDHLGLALRVFGKACKVRVIHNINAFLNWLISFKEPFDFFTKRDEAFFARHSKPSSTKPSLLQRIKPKFTGYQQRLAQTLLSRKPPASFSRFNWTVVKLRSIKERCIFLSHPEKPTSMNAGKVYVYFGKNTQNEEHSYLKAYFYWNDGLYGRFAEELISMKSPQFKTRFLAIFFPNKAALS